eukprot:1159959-Pelagomonas_calceolata.AAC.5
MQAFPACVIRMLSSSHASQLALGVPACTGKGIYSGSPMHTVSSSVTSNRERKKMYAEDCVF